MLLRGFFSSGLNYWVDWLDVQVNLNAFYKALDEGGKEIFSVSGRQTNRPQCTMSEFRIGEVLKEAKPWGKKENEGP